MQGYSTAVAVTDSIRRSAVARRSIIATTQPKLFAAKLAPEIGHSVFIYGTGEEALMALRAGGITDFYADFQQLPDRWNGMRLIRQIRSRPEFAHVRVWLMAESWPASQEKWIQRCGATGMVRRSGRVLAARILSEALTLPISLELELDEVDKVFYRYAGPMRSMYVESARVALNQGWIEPTAEAYIDRLTSTLPIDAARGAFLDALERHRRNAARKKRSTEQGGRSRRSSRSRKSSRSALRRAADALWETASRFRERSRSGESSFFVSSLLANWLGRPSRQSQHREQAAQTEMAPTQWSH